MTDPHPERGERDTLHRRRFVALLKDHTQSLRLLDRRLGAATLLAQTSAHVKQIEELLCYALPNAHRSATAAALGEVASLAGWQALDIGQLGQAWRHYETAKAGAREGGDPAVLGYVTAEQAYVLLDAGHAAEALQMVQYARDREPGRLPPVLRAWLLAAEGEVRAALGDRSGALRALDGAAQSLPSQPTRLRGITIRVGRRQFAPWLNPSDGRPAGERAPAATAASVPELATRRCCRR